MLCSIGVLLGMLILPIFNFHISIIPSQSKLNIPEIKVKYSLSHMNYLLNVINDILKVLYWKHCAKYTSVGWFRANKIFLSKQGVTFVTYVWFKLRTCVQHKIKLNCHDVNLP